MNDSRYNKNVNTWKNNLKTYHVNRILDGNITIFFMN